MDLIPFFAGSTTSSTPMKTSRESKEDIEGSCNPDPRIELGIYKQNYLEALNDLGPTSILADQNEATVFAENS